MYDVIAIIIAPIVGIIVGLLPAIGALMTMIAFYPLLVAVDPLTSICFYAMMLTASQFSGSVAAIWFGVLGESTSIPVLQERSYVINNNLHMVALRNTSYSSIVAAIISSALLILVIYIGVENKWLLRSETLALILSIVLLFCVFWPENKWYWNVCLILFGLFLGYIGFDPLTRTEFFTFGNSYLYGGLPNMSVVLGLYAVPMLFLLYKKKYVFDSIKITNQNSASFPLISSVRGSIIGFFSGLLPMIGTIISSNLAHFIEKRLNKNELERITSAEASNNAAVISVLIPLLLLGLPIQPSELVLYEIITTNNWLKTDVTQLHVLFLAICILFTAAVSYLICFTFVGSIAELYHKNYKLILNAVIFLIICNVLYTGWQSDQTIYYFVVFTIMLMFGILLSRLFDLLPALMAFLLQDQFFLITNRLVEIYS